MPATAILFGRLLILLGIFGYGYGMFTGAASVTSLIPAFFGLVLMVMGHIAQAKEGLRKHVMHAAVIVALVGFLAVIGNLGARFDKITVGVALLVNIVMAVLCAAFVILAVRSFIAARRGP